MKRVVMSLVCGVAVVAMAALFTGCASSHPIGVIYTDVKLPEAATSNAAGAKEKVGVSTCQSIIACVAQGDASIQAAMKNGGITKIHHVDWEANNILGIIGNYKCTVYGE